ncbi:MAG: phosphate ABC transporter permease subunit PstC [Prevotellaceae bacterium]|jgi:phosphate transport system permease protein|nr:phosphate ABC transporter permease subunit PstC [Prevotellaceae bacterium]
MKKKLKRIAERLIEAVFTLSGGITSLAIILIIVFLFKEGAGLFGNPTVEHGYELCVNAENPVKKLSSQEIKQIFDGDITNWNEVGGRNEEIMLFRFDDIFNVYPEEEFGADYEFLPTKIDEYIALNKNIIAFIPEKYLLNEELRTKNEELGQQPNSSFYILHSSLISPADFFNGKEWLPTATPAAQFGVLPLILGTLLVSIVAIIIALPLGLGAAIYLSELAGERVRRVLKPAIELLAGIPSVVYGFFGLVVLAPLIQSTFDLAVGETALAGSVILAIMALPTIISVSEDAMRNTPRTMREASLALGADRWQTVYKVVVPYASSGIAAAVVLGIGRAVGETMAVLMVTGNAAVMPTSLFEPVRTIPATIAAELGEAPAGGAHYQALFLLGCILFLITLVISLSAEMIKKRRLE